MIKVYKDKIALLKRLYILKYMNHSGMMAKIIKAGGNLIDR